MTRLDAFRRFVSDEFGRDGERDLPKALELANTGFSFRGKRYLVLAQGAEMWHAVRSAVRSRLPDYDGALLARWARHRGTRVEEEKLAIALRYLEADRMPLSMVLSHLIDMDGFCNHLRETTADEELISEDGFHAVVEDGAEHWHVYRTGDRSVW